MLIERQGETVALRGVTGNLVFPPATASSYSVDNWLLADGDDRGAESAADGTVFRCDLLGCIGTVKDKRVALKYVIQARWKRTAGEPISSLRRLQSARNVAPRA